MSRNVIAGDVELRRPDPDAPYDLVQASFKSEAGLDFTVFVQPQNNPPETWGKFGYPLQFLEAGISRDAFEKLARAIVKEKLFSLECGTRENLFAIFNGVNR